MTRLRTRAFLATLSGASVASGSFAQSYQTSTGQYTTRRPESVLAISQLLGRGTDWLSYPTFDLSFNTQFEYDFTHFNGDGSSSNLVNTSDLTTTLLLAPRLAIYSDLTLDQVNGPNPGENSWLEGEGIFSSSLFIQYSNQFVTVGGGQFTPNFGIANALAPGLYGGNFVGDYSFDDQLGLFGSLAFGREQVGNHIFSGSLFMVDTTFLSNSIITKQGQTSRSDGGPGNTGSLDNFALSYDGQDVPILGMPILQYQLGFISQGAGEDGDARQYGFVAGAAITIPLDRDPYATVANRYQSLQPLIEYAHFENWTGMEGATADYLTLGLDYWYGDWNLSVSGTTRSLDDIPGQSNDDDLLIQATIGYQLYGYQALEGNGQISFGWAYQRIGGEPQNTIGFAISLGWDVLNNFQLFKGW